MTLGDLPEMAGYPAKPSALVCKLDTMIGICHEIANHLDTIQSFENGIGYLASDLGRLGRKRCRK